MYGSYNVIYIYIIVIGHISYDIMIISFYNIAEHIVYIIIIVIIIILLVELSGCGAFPESH